MTAHEDHELLPWLLGIANSKPVPSGDFLRSLADAALLEFRARYPKYHFLDADLERVFR